VWQFRSPHHFRGGGRLVGLVTSETIGEMMMVREAMPKGTDFGPWGPIAKT
jgi:hypothetical protein